MSLVRNDRGEPDEPLALIARNVEAVLNSRPGHGSVLEVYGLGEPEGWDRHAGQIRGLEKALLLAVQRFEPRLREPAVRCVARDSSLWIRFELSGTVRGEPRKLAVRYHAILRHVVVEPVGQGAGG